MTRRTGTIAPDYFDALYSAKGDPWGFSTSQYERDKYEATLGALGRQHYGRALEVGCSIGIFTRRLASRCDALTAIDASVVAVEAARRACADCGNVSVELGMVPSGFPDGRFDLILLSEVLYYLDVADLWRVADRCAETLAPDGEVVLCHWLGETDYPLTGEQASDLFAEAIVKRLPSRAILNGETYRLERLSRP